MKTSDFKSLSLNQREKFFGSCWLVFETLYFASLLQALNGLLPTPLPKTEVNFVFFSVNFAVIVWMFRRYLLKQLRLIPDVFWKIVYTTIPGFIAYWVLTFLLAQAFYNLDPNFSNVNDAAVQGLVAQDYALMFVEAVILVPITEECLFRGLVFRGIYDRNAGLAWMASILLFSLVHVLGYIDTHSAGTILLCFVQYIPAGICLAGAYRLSGSLLSPILIHALVNFVGMMSLR